MKHPSQNGGLRHHLGTSRVLVLLFGLVLGFATSPGSIAQSNTDSEKSSSTPPSEGTKPLGPRIEFETPSHDFGKVRAKEKFHYEYVFKNVGDQPLVISKVKTSCSCFSAESFDREVAPGATGKIKARFESRSFRGKISKHLTIHSNIDATRRPRVSMSADVFTPIRISPTHASFGSAIELKGKSKSLTMTLENQTDRPLELKTPVCELSQFAVELIEVDPGRLFQLKIDTVPPLESGFNKGFIKIETNFPELSRLNVFVSAHVPPEVIVQPTMVRIPSPCGRAMTRNLYVRHARGVEFSIDKLRIDDPEPSPLPQAEPAEPQDDTPQLKVTLFDYQQKNHAYRIFLEIPEGYVLPENGLRLRFETDEPAYPTVTIPIKSTTLGRAKGAERKVQKEAERVQQELMRKSAKKARQSLKKKKNKDQTRE